MGRRLVAHTGARAGSSDRTRTNDGEIERGEVTATIVTARKIAAALGMTLAGLFRELED